MKRNQLILLLILLRRDKPDATAGMVRFEAVKGKTADKLAKRVFDGEALPDRAVSARELEALLRWQ